jgi:type III pantothenate kinase
VIGTNTAAHMQAGLYYGTIDMVDGMLARIKAELGENAKVIATGGQAGLIAKGSKHIEHTDEFLTLHGLRIIWERNHGEKSSPAKTKSPARMAD